MKISDIKPQVYEMAAKAQARCRKLCRDRRGALENNTPPVMEAFQEFNGL